MSGQYGKVHVFNNFNESISGLSVGGYAVDDIPAWSTAPATLYTPAQLSVARTANPIDSPAFAVGDNEVIIPWISFRGRATVTIPNPQSGISLTDDLILYLTVNQAMLLTTRGHYLASFRIVTEFLSPAELDAANRSHIYVTLARLAQDDPILDAKTIQQLAVALNDAYHIGLPTSWPPESEFLEQMWEIDIQVKPGSPPLLYIAAATEGLPFNKLPVFLGMMFVNVEQDSEKRRGKP